MKKKLALILWLFSFYLHAEAISDDAERDNLYVLDLQEEIFTNNENYGLQKARIELGAAFGNYIGIRHGYTELGLFEMFKMPDSTFVFVESRGFLLSNKDWIASLGVGFRKPLSHVVLGANVYYDYENAKISKEDDYHLKSLRRNFGSIGIGLEVLAECVDFRTNVYLPVQAKQTTKSFFTYPGGYLLDVKAKYFIQYGIDAEIGKRLNLCAEFYADGAIGGYSYFSKHTESICGPFARLELWWQDFLSLQARYSYDKHYNSSFQGKIMISFPLEQIVFLFNKCCVCFDPITQPVRRNYIPFIQEECCWKWNW